MSIQDLSPLSTLVKDTHPPDSCPAPACTPRSSRADFGGGKRGFCPGGEAVNPCSGAVLFCLCLVTGCSAHLASPSF